MNGIPYQDWTKETFPISPSKKLILSQLVGATRLASLSLYFASIPYPMSGPTTAVWRSVLNSGCNMPILLNILITWCYHMLPAGAPGLESDYIHPSAVWPYSVQSAIQFLEFAWIESRIPGRVSCKPPPIIAITVQSWYLSHPAYFCALTQ